MPEKQDRHILIVFHSSLPEIKGGINKMIVTLARAWEKLGHRVSILSPGGWEDRLWSSHRYGDLTVHRQRLRLPWDRERPLRGLLGWVREFPEILWKLRQFVRDERVDIIHLHTPREYQFFFRLLRFFGGPPYIITFHGTDALHFSLGQAKHMKLLRWIVRGASGVTAVARHYATLIQNHHPDLAPVRAIANGIDVNSAPSPDVEPSNLPSGSFTLPQHFFVQVGWVEPPKAQDVAIQAWGLLKKNHPNLHLLIIGEEPLLHPGEPYYPGYLQKIKDMIVALGCSATVHMAGSMTGETLYAVMRKSSGLVFPSQREGLPYVLLEAGLVGLPVVCSEIPAFCELITHENNGLLFPVGDHVSLAREVDRLVRDEELARRVGTHWHHTVTSQLTDRQMADNYLDYFNEILEKPDIANHGKNRHVP